MIRKWPSPPQPSRFDWPTIGIVWIGLAFALVLYMLHEFGSLREIILR